MVRSLGEMGQAEWQGRVTRLRPKTCLGAVGQCKGGSRNRAWVRRGGRWEQTFRWVTYFDVHTFLAQWRPFSRFTLKLETNLIRSDACAWLNLNRTILRRTLLALLLQETQFVFSSNFSFPSSPATIIQQPLSAFGCLHRKTQQGSIDQCKVMCGIFLPWFEVKAEWRLWVTSHEKLKSVSGRAKLGRVGL